MSLEHEVAALAARADESAMSRIKMGLRMAFERRRTKAYQAVFLDADGALTPHGRTVIADLGAVAHVGRIDPRASNEELRFREGQRSIVLHILASFSLDDAKFDRLARQLKESGNE